MQEKELNRASVKPSVVIAIRSDGKISNAVTVEITHRGHVPTEAILVIENFRESTGGVTDFLVMNLEKILSAIVFLLRVWPWLPRCRQSSDPRETTRTPNIVAAAA